MAGGLNLLKLCVGVSEVDELIGWQALRRAETGRSHAFHTTRMWPRRAEELLDGGSLYWVMKGEIRARQRILGLDRTTGSDGVQRCTINLAEDVVRVQRVARRPFQGWRYLEAGDAPPDLAVSTTGSAPLPDDLAAALMDIGVV